MYRQLSLWELEVNEFGAGDVPGSMRCLVKRPSAFLCFAAAVPAIGVEGWVEGIVVLGIQMFLDDAQGFTEPGGWKQKEPFLNIPGDFHSFVCNPYNFDKRIGYCLPIFQRKHFP